MNLCLSIELVGGIVYYKYVLIRSNMGHLFWYICPYRYAAFPLLSAQGG